MKLKRPENVRVIKVNGDVIPCELAYLGPNEKGFETWEIATSLEMGDKLKVGLWPAETSIVCPVNGWRE